jgi:quercetin dioxygenase-like cupin family protein
MAQEQSQRLTPETMGNGVIDFRKFQRFAPEEGTVVPVYGDQDMRLTQWNLEPGQENSRHVHHVYGQALIILQGAGEALRGEDEPPIPIKAGDIFMAPRGVPHGIHNTGTERLTYLTISNNTPEGFQREPIGEQRVSIGREGGGGH